MASDPHPNVEHLLEYARGQLDVIEIERISHHLEACPDCQETVARLEIPSDTLLNALRAGPVADAYAEEPECQQAVAAVEQLAKRPRTQTGPLPDPAGDRERPTRVRDYRIVRELRRGGMGQVFVACHERLGRLVALKVLRPERTRDPQSVGRFLREMKAVGGLLHPNIVHAYDAGEVDGQHFLVMELVDGVDLSTLTDGGKTLNLMDACEVIRQAAVGLQHAHEFGLVHRDLKPSNLMLATDGTVKVLDLGLARLQDEQDRFSRWASADSPTTAADSPIAERSSSAGPIEAELTHSGQIMGTPDYMAPEQCTDIRQADIRSDIYSLGATLFQLLTGSAPYGGPAYDTVGKKIRGLLGEPTPDIRRRLPDLPDEFVHVLGRMLAKDPRDRFATPLEVAQALTPFVEGHQLARLVSTTGQPEPGVMTAVSADSPRREERPAADASATRLRSAVRRRSWRTTFGVLGSAISIGFLIWLATDRRPWQNTGARGDASESVQAAASGIAPSVPSATASAVAPTPQPEVTGSKPTVPSADPPLGGEPVATEAAGPQPAAVPVLAPDPLPTVQLAVVRHLSDVEWIDSQLPTDTEAKTIPSWRWTLRNAIQPYAVLDGPGEAYLVHNLPQPGHYSGWRLAISVAAARDVTGTVYLPKSDTSGLWQLHFRVPAAQLTAEAGVDFWQAKFDHYDRLTGLQLPGAAWFRFQRDVAAGHLGRGPAQDATRSRDRLQWLRMEPEHTLEFLSGGTAISENLQLDEIPPVVAEEEATVPLSRLPGLTVAAFDWSAQPQEQHELDPLAAVIPADQYAILFPTFTDVLTTIDQLEQRTQPWLTVWNLGGDDAETRQFYEQQLGLPLSTLARELGPRFIDSIAITGGDLYFRSGTDVAVLFQTSDPGSLSTLLTAQRYLVFAKFADAQQLHGQLGTISYHGLLTRNRSLCSYQATLGDHVIVTNSLVQLQRLVDAYNKSLEPLAASPEYRFFRHRYPRGADDETGWVIMTDAAIRRWCSPRWRVAASRRLRAAAVLSDLNARYQDQRLARLSEPAQATNLMGTLPPNSRLAGTISLYPTGAEHPVYGSLKFLTPISELSFENVTTDEESMYRRWLTGYQSHWRRYFDPIAIRFAMRSDRFTSDLTVMPLISGSDYRWLTSLTEGSQIDVSRFKSYSSQIGKLVLSLNQQSQPSRMVATMITSAIPGARPDFFDWMGPTVEISLEDSPKLDEIVDHDDPELGMAQDWPLVPLVIRCEVVNPAKLPLFLAAVRTYLDGSATGMLTWEPQRHGDTEYMRISLRNNSGESAPRDNPATLCYAANSQWLTITLSEDTLKQVLDRDAKELAAPSSTEDAASQVATELLGENMHVEVSPRLVDLLQRAQRKPRQASLANVAWRNLPILNEWHRRYPDRDLVELHAMLWDRKLISPAAGVYQWNETWQTMECSQLGHPGDLRQPVNPPPGLEAIRSGRFGLTFRDGGLRARVQIDLQPETPTPAP